MIFPVPVPIIGVMVRDDHSLEAMFLQDRNILLKPYFAVNGTLFDVAVHIDLHTQSPLSLLSVLHYTSYDHPVTT